MQGITDYGDYFDYGGIKVAKAGLSPEALDAYSKVATVAPPINPDQQLPAAEAPIIPVANTPQQADPQMLQAAGKVSLAPPVQQPRQPQQQAAPSGGGRGYSLPGMIKEFMQPLPSNEPMQQTFKDNIAAQQNIANSEAAFQKAKSDELTLDNVQRDQDIQAQVARNKQIDADIRSRHAEIGRLADTYANSKLDADAWWNNKSTGQKAVAGIAMILGGIGAALAGGENMGLRVIQDAINRDVDTQKFNIDRMGRNLQSKRESLQDLRTTVKDEDDRRQAVINSRYNMVLNRINELQSRTASEEQQSKFEALKSQLEQQMLQQNQGWAMQKKQVLGQQIGLAASLQGGGGQKPADLKDVGHYTSLTNGKAWEGYETAKNAYQQLQAARASGAYNLIPINVLANSLKQGSFSENMLNLSKTLGFGDRIEDAVSSIVTGKNRNYLDQLSKFIEQDYLQKNKSMADRVQTLREGSQKLFGRPNVFTGNPDGMESMQSLGIKPHGAK